MKICLVADEAQWAFGHIADHIARRSAHDVTVIYSGEFESTEHLCRYLVDRDFSVVHFFWRIYFDAVLNTILKNINFDSLLDAKFSFSIPDYSHLSPRDANTNQRIINNAAGIVFTNTELKETYASRFSHDGLSACIADPLLHDIDEHRALASIHASRRSRLKVAWIGNSEWNAGFGLPDHKGFDKIWTPLAEHITSQGHELIEIDKNRELISREQVLERLYDADVLCMTSAFEGTSLPVIEAMATGNAVITTNTGIFPFICNDLNQSLLVRRNPRSFVQAFQKLDGDRDFLARAAADNVGSIAAHAGSGIIADWDRFFSRLSEQKTGDERALFMRRARGSLCTNRIGTCATTSVQLAPVAITTSRWPGVRNSTRALFDRQLELPFAGARNDSAAQAEAMRLVSALPISAPIVISGGDECHQALVNYDRSFFAQRNTSLLWHGSLTQWNEGNHHDQFGYWLDRLRDGTISGVACFKEDVAALLATLKRNHYLLKNRVPGNFGNIARLQEYGSPMLADNMSHALRVGIFSASSGAYKNAATQIMAARILGSSNVEVHIPSVEPFERLFRRYRIPVFEVGKGHTQEEMLRCYEQVDLALYVTFTECSPMIPLESVHCGTPCIVSPASNIYQDYPELEKYLLVDRPDDAGLIAARIEDCRNNYDVILQLLQQFRRSEDRVKAFILDGYATWLRAGDRPAIPASTPSPGRRELAASNLSI